MTIAIIDYGLGNLKSVCKALAYLRADAYLTSDPDAVRSADALVLPGVGAFGRGMDNLRRAGLDEATRAAAASGTPLIGICLGLQLLFESSEEARGVDGLGILRGTCLRFTGPGFDSGALKSPHMGWNSLTPTGAQPILDGVADGDMAYFVHSFYPVPTDPSVVAANTTHGIEFCSVVSTGNVFACQFHPEKSGKTGMRILANFVRIADNGDHSGS